MMLLSSVLIPGASVLRVVHAQSFTASYLEPSVPTGAPIAGDYSGALRPQIHFSPPQHFMNDPCGLHLDPSGIYHMYYQYNPTGNIAGNQHWGHATSEDLFHWTNQPIAIYPGADGEAIFTGSAVIDVNNTSGFFPNQTNGVVAIYTLNTAQEEVQEVAYSADGGYTFTKYLHNPVISVNSTQFRDPKVIWHAATSSWVMVVSYAQAFTIGIYTSPNLTNWTHASNFTHAGLLGLQYECPNLVPIPTILNASVPFALSSANFAPENMYVLLVSINPGAPLGGSITQYFPGSFNGTHFIPVDSAARIADFGKDNYAGQFFSDMPSTAPPLSVAWASNWQYAQSVPTGPLENFRSAMTLPRINALANITSVGYDLVSIPSDLRGRYTTTLPLAANTSLGNGSLLLDYGASVPSGALYLALDVTSIPSSATATGTANITFLSSVTGESLRGGFFLGGPNQYDFFIDRGRVRGFENPFFTDKVSVNNPVDPDTGIWRLEMVIDRSILEVFLDGGQRSATTSFFSEGELDTLMVSTEGLNEGIGVSVQVWGLQSAWVAEEVGWGNGSVAGNLTQMARRDVWGHL